MYSTYLQQIRSYNLHNLYPPIRPEPRIFLILRSPLPSFEITERLQHHNLEIVRIAEFLYLARYREQFGKVVAGYLMATNSRAVVEDIRERELDASEASSCDGFEFLGEGVGGLASDGAGGIGHGNIFDGG